MKIKLTLIFVVFYFTLVAQKPKIGYFNQDSLFMICKFDVVINKSYKTVTDSLIDYSMQLLDIYKKSEKRFLKDLNKCWNEKEMKNALSDLQMQQEKLIAFDQKLKEAKAEVEKHFIEFTLGILLQNINQFARENGFAMIYEMENLLYNVPPKYNENLTLDLAEFINQKSYNDDFKKKIAELINKYRN